MNNQKGSIILCKSIKEVEKMNGKYSIKKHCPKQTVKEIELRFAFTGGD